MKVFLFALIAVLAGTRGAIAADSMSGMNMDSGAAGQWAAFGEPGSAAGITRTVAIAAGEMYFDPDKLTAHVGDTIKFVVTNKGHKDHEFVIGDAAFHQQHQQAMASMPGMVMNAPNEIQLKPGETRSLIWRFTKAGDFVFACDIPGYADAGMEGEIAVK